MDPLPRQIGGLLPWVSAARWFPAKADGGRLVLHDAARIPAGDGSKVGQEQQDGARWIAVVDVMNAVGVHAAPSSLEPVRLVLPLAECEGQLVDAAADERFIAWLLGAVVAGGRLPTGQAAFRGHAAAMSGPLPARPPLVRRVGADASNTSLAVSWQDGPAFVVKLVRRCREGIHPEVEVGLFLAASNGRVDVPRLVGWLDHAAGAATGQTGAASVLAVVHERIEARGSAWDVMLESVVSDWGGCLAIAGSLGESTARLHAALAAREDSPAFVPEPWTRDAWAASTRSMADHAVAVIDRLQRSASPAVAAAVQRLVSQRDRIVEVFSDAPPPRESCRIRVHGDYHLGQVLVTGDGDVATGVDGKAVGCTVIDFEGEPGRPLDERRRKTSAAKDVAGMCRSFDYLLRVAAKDGRRAYDARGRTELEASFLAAYAAASRMLAAKGLPGVRWWPEDPGEASRLLRVYTLDKAVYELAYEADNRPGWIDVPASALAELTG